ncbi:hypothetical protein F7725_010989 [Dissostichus mawsoni]|nr:hypothetical protein F7725_010989 [Dissostichus mawsoni]
MQARIFQLQMFPGLPGSGGRVVCFISWQYSSSLRGFRSWPVCSRPWISGTGSDTPSSSHLDVQDELLRGRVDRGFGVDDVLDGVGPTRGLVQKLGVQTSLSSGSTTEHRLFRTSVPSFRALRSELL